MAFQAITALVLVMLVFTYRRLAEVYGHGTLAKLTGVTLVYFFVKELLQAHKLLVHHHYTVNLKAWISLFGVPPFVVFGHLFVVLMTWQLAVMTMRRLRLEAHPIVLILLVWHFTSAFSMLMENTGIVGGWWVWKMPSWWWFPTFEGAPLRDLPMDRPITEVWGYFISTFWFVVLLTDLPRKWSIGRVTALVVFLAISVEGSRMTSTSIWSKVEFYLPLASVLLPAAWTLEGRRLLPSADSILLRPPGPRQYAAVLAGLFAMCAVATVQLCVKSRGADLVSLFPIVMFTAGAFRRWPLWVDAVVSGVVLLVGLRLHSGNVMLAGYLVDRFCLELMPLLLVVRWREGSSSGSLSVAPEVAAASSAAG
ncbi:MAG: hypothetical protein ACRENE_35505 [Polyangiaceae bacterium]